MGKWLESVTESDRTEAAPKPKWSDLAADPEPLNSVRNQAAEFPFGPDLEREKAMRLGEPEPPGIIERLKQTFTGSDRATPETDSLPEIDMLRGGPGTNLRYGVGLMAASDPAQVADIIKKNFPDAVFSQDDKGNLFVESGGKKYQFNKPGLSNMDVGQGLTEFLSYLPAGKATSMVRGGLGKTAVAAGGGAATSVARDVAAAGAGSEQGIDPGRAVGAAVGEALLPAAGAVGRKMLGREVPTEAGNAIPDMIQGTTEAGKASGIDLFPAQRTGLLSQLEKQRFVAELPGGSQIAANALLKQNKQAHDAVINYLNEIAPASAVETGARRFRTASEKLNESIKRARAEKSSPIYERAWGEDVTVDTAPVVQIGRGIVDEYPVGGKIATPVAKAVKMIKATGGNLKRLHNVKTEIDQMLQSGVGASSGPLRGTARRELTRIQDSLLEAMDAASPTYAQARATFRDNSGIIDEVGQSIVGKVSGIADDKLNTLSQKVFDASETNPEVIRRTRDLIDSVDPGAYDELLRVELERRIGKAAVTQEGIQNTPGQMVRMIYGNDAQKKALYAALRPEQRYVAQQLELALRAAAKGRPGGSQTATRQELREEIRGGWIAALRNFISSPMKAVGEAGERVAIERKAQAVARVMYDPAYTKDVDAIIRMMRYDPNSAQQQMARLLQSALAVQGADMGEDLTANR